MSGGLSQVLTATIKGEEVFYVRGFELISRTQGGDINYYLYDGGLSVRTLTDEKGEISDRYIFDAFGNETEKTGNTDNPYGFQGEEKDATGLIYLRARYMDPSTGTFTTMDTYGGRISDPASLHKYLFANSNPVMYCDPSGYLGQPTTDQLITMGIECILLGATIGGFGYLFRSLIVDGGKEYSFSGFLQSYLNGASMGLLSFLGFNLVAQWFDLSVALDIAFSLGAASGTMTIKDGIEKIKEGRVREGVFDCATGLAMTVGAAWGFKKVRGGGPDPAPDPGPDPDPDPNPNPDPINPDPEPPIVNNGGSGQKVYMTGKEGEAELARLVGGESQQYMKTSIGGRYIDQLSADNIAHESKVGYTTLTKRVRMQVLKDAELINTGRVEGAHWHFFTSGVTGKGGASQPLLDLLSENGISYTIH